MLGLVLRLVILSCTLILIACDSSRLTALEPEGRIVAFGDSLTVGVGTTDEYSYPSVLARLTGHEVVNSGVSGETTAEGLIRLQNVLEDLSPSLLILLEGGNDILRNNDAEKIENNLRKMIEMAKSQGVEVVLIGVPEKSLFSSSAPYYEKLADQYDLVFDSDLIASLMKSPSKKSDAIHFNRAGYKLLAEGIFELLAANGALN